MCNAIAPLVRRGPVDYCFSPGIHPAAGSFVFSGSVSTKDLGAAQLRYFRLEGLTKMAMITSTDASGQDAARNIHELLARAREQGPATRRRADLQPDRRQRLGADRAHQGRPAAGADRLVHRRRDRHRVQGGPGCRARRAGRDHRRQHDLCRRWTASPRSCRRSSTSPRPNGRSPTRSRTRPTWPPRSRRSTPPSRAPTSSPTTPPPSPGTRRCWSSARCASSGPAPPPSRSAATSTSLKGFAGAQRHLRLPRRAAARPRASTTSSSRAGTPRRRSGRRQQGAAACRF